MTPLEERNTVWNMLELLIDKYRFENQSEFLDPEAEDRIIFGNMIGGHPMSFEGEFKDMITELTRILPSDYVIAKSYVFDDANGCVGIVKI